MSEPASRVLSTSWYTYRCCVAQDRRAIRQSRIAWVKDIGSRLINSCRWVGGAWISLVAVRKAVLDHEMITAAVLADIGGIGR